MSEVCQEDVKDVLREVKRAFDGYDERGYYTYEEIKRASESLSDLVRCIIKVREAES